MVRYPIMRNSLTGILSRLEHSENRIEGMLPGQLRIIGLDSGS